MKRVNVVAVHHLDPDGPERLEKALELTSYKRIFIERTDDEVIYYQTHLNDTMKAGGTLEDAIKVLKEYHTTHLAHTFPNISKEALTHTSSFLDYDFLPLLLTL